MIKKKLFKFASVFMCASVIAMTFSACGAKGNVESVAIETSAKVDAKTSNSSVESTLAETLFATTTSSASKNSKDETVYVFSDANGNVDHMLVSNKLKNFTGVKTLSDMTSLKNITNVSGEEGYKANGESLTWDAEGNSITYQGTTDKKTPVTVKVTYKLDGKEISAKDLAGKSGKVTIHFDYTNNEKTSITVNGKKQTAYVPFSVVTGMVLPADKFSNIQITNGKLVETGKENIVIGLAMPGLEDSLSAVNLGDKKLDIDIPNSFEVTADVKNFELDETLSVVSNNLLSDIKTDKIDTSSLKADSDKLADASNQLIDGTNKLYDGTNELKDGTSQLKDGTSQLADGAGQLTSKVPDLVAGVNQLKDGAGQLADGIDQVKDGADKLSSGSAALKDGIYAYADGVGQVDEGAEALDNNMGTLSNGLDTLYAKLLSNNFDAGVHQLAVGAAQLEGATPELIAGISQLSTGSANLASGLVAYTDGVSQAKTGADKLAAGISQLAGKANAGISQLATGANSLLDGANQVKTGAAELAAGANAVNEGVNGTSGLKNTLANNEAALKTQYEQAYNTAYQLVVKANTALTMESMSSAIQSSIANQLASIASAQGVSVGQLPAETVESVTSAVKNQYQQQVAAGVTQSLAGKGIAAEADITDTDANANPRNQVVTMSAALSQVYSSTASSTDESMQALSTQAMQSLLTINQASAAYRALSSTDAALQGDGTATNPGLYAATQSLAAGAASLAEGTGDLASGAQDLNAGISGEAGLSSQLSAGITQLSDGASELDTGLTTLDGKSSELNSGASQISGGLAQINANAPKLQSGAKQLSEGLAKLEASVGVFPKTDDEATANPETLCSALYQLKNGANQLKSQGTEKIKAGLDQINSNSQALKGGIDQVADGSAALADGANKLSAGSITLKDGTNQLANGAVQLADGATQLADGINQVNDGAIKLDDGAIQLNEGALTLRDGMVQFNNEGLSKITKLLGTDADTAVKTFEEITKLGKSYQTFTGKDADTEGSVRFIVKTAGITVE